MFIQQLFEGEIKRVIAIYPGRFQPFHLGHKEVFQALQAKFGMDNVFIGTSNKTDAVKSPFNFSDKLQLMTAAGVNNHHVLEVTSPYMPDDYIRTIGFNPAETVLIFAVGAPDLKRLEVDAHYTALTPTGRPSKIPDGKSVGDPKPFKTFQSLQDCVTADQHQYVLIVNEREKKVVVNGKEFDASHGTQVRELWNEVRNDPQASAQVLQQLYGHATPELAHIFNKIPDANAAPAPVPAAAPKLKAVKQPKQDVSKELKEAMLTEAMLQEAFLDSIKQTLGNAVNVHVTNVTNATQALQVLYRVVSDPKYLDTMAFLLKKRLKDIIKSLPTNIRIAVKLKEFLNSMFPEGRTLGDFFKALLLVALGKSGLAIAMTIKNEAQEALLASIIEAIKQIPQFAGSILSGGAGAIGNVLQSLKIGNAIWFELLTYLNSKIEYANTLGTNRNPAMAEEAAGVGVVANKKQKNDPRYSTSMTQDVGPGEDKKNMKKLHLESNRGYTQGFASPTAPSLGGSRRREDDEYHVPDPTPSTWYIRADGKIIKDKMGTPFQFRDKEAARKAAMTMMAKPFNAGKKFMLTTKPQDDAPVAEDRTETKNEKGEVTSWRDESDWRKISKDKNGRGKVTNLSDKARRETEKLTKKQEVAEGSQSITHRIGLTVTDPNHPMVSKRGETYQKSVRVTSDHREAAINQAIAHYRRKGYKVHAHHYMGTVDEATDNGISKDAETKFHAKLDTLVHDTFGKRDSEQGMAEGMEGQVVYAGTGGNGGKYEIIQSGPDSFMIHANGKHVDTYQSLQRAMGVLQNEVPGLTKEVDEASLKLNYKRNRFKSLRNMHEEEAEEFIWNKPHPNAKPGDAKVKVSPYIWDRPHPNAKPGDAKVKVSPYIWDRPHPNAKPGTIDENAEELSVGDPVIITGQGIEFEGKTGDIDSFGSMKRFVVVNLYNHGKHSFHSSDVSYNDHADQEEVDEDMYQYNKDDPYDSEFAPRAGMGRMTLRGWKQQMIKRTAELAQQMAAAGQDIDKSALWDNVHAKLKSMNMDPIAQEIEQAQAELEKIRQRGGVRSRAFNK